MAALVGIIVLVAGVATASARTGASARHPLKKARPSASPTKWRALAAAVPSPSNLHVLTVTKTTASVSWTPPATGVAGYTLYRNGKRVGTTTQTSYAFGKLRCARSYTLAVDAYTASGTHSAKVAVTATTAACTTADTTPPGTPGGLVSTGSTATSVSLAWSASSDNVGTVGYDVFTNGTRSGSTTSLSYTVSGLACGTSYSFSVDAYDAAGNVSARGNIAAATSACAAPLDTLPPSTPTGLVVSGSTQTSISVGWSPSVDNVGVTGYGLYRNGTRVTNVATPGATFSSLTCGTTYTLGVDAYDAAGNRSATTTLAAATAACPADTTPPSAPTGLSVTGQAGTSVSLAWNASTDNVGVTGYGLYRDGTLIGTAPSPSGTFSSLTCGTTYTFAVDAFDAAGNRSAATPLSASTSACPPPGGTGTANLWVDTDGGSCLRHASPVAYTSSEACGSFDAANDHCLAGDSVRIKGGAYSSQGLTGSNGRADYCSMAEADGETVTSSGLDFGGAAWVSVQGVAVTGGTPSAPKTVGLGGSGTTVASHIRLIDVSAYPGRLFIKGSYLTVQGGEFGGYDDCLTGSENDGIQVSYVSGSPPSSQITIDGIYLHDVRRTCGTTHTDCIQFLGIQSSVIENSRIENCPTTGIMARPQGGANVLDGLTIQNNFVGPVLDGYEAWNIGTSPDNCTNVAIQYNTFAAGGSIDCVVTTGNVFRGNLVSGTAGCQSATFSYNRWSSGTACGTSGGICTAQYVNPGGRDYHLLSSDTCAHSRGGSVYPADDIDGQARPESVAEIGADEIP